MAKKAEPYRKGDGRKRGRPKGALSGRAQALGILDKILGTPANKGLLTKRLSAVFRADPYKFFKQVVMPLLPKESLIKMETTGEKAGIRILVQGPKPPSAKKATRKTKGTEL